MCPLDEYHRRVAADDERTERLRLVNAEFEAEKAREEAEEARRKEAEKKWKEEHLAIQKAKAEELRPQFLARREDFIKAHLQAIGIAPQELTARWDRVPEAIRKALPKQWKSFGLVGGYGAGKTFGIAAILRRHTERLIDNHMQARIEASDVGTIERAISQGALPLRPWPLWVNWPEEVVRARSRVYDHGAEVEEWILGLQESDRLLILDDLGADRMAGQDYTGEVLARIIDDRLRNVGMTIWTSNLDTKGLVERYGPRTYSRLQQLAPMIQLPKLPDQRLTARRENP